MKIYNQRLYPNNHLGFSPTRTLASDGCKLCSYAMIAGIDPVTLNEQFKKDGVFVNGCLIDDVKACQSLGWHWIGRQTTIDPMPKQSPIIKEVDFSPAPGKQQHFTVRISDATGRYIIDPWGGVTREINYYEKKANNIDWSKPGQKGNFSYRIFTTK